MYDHLHIPMCDALRSDCTYCTPEFSADLDTFLWAQRGLPDKYNDVWFGVTLHTKNISKFVKIYLMALMYNLISGSVAK